MLVKDQFFKIFISSNYFEFLFKTISDNTFLILSEIFGNQYFIFFSLKKFFESYIWIFNGTSCVFKSF